jgi:hypothetical protein
MVFPLVLLTAAAAGGTAATYLYQRHGSFPWRLAAGTVTGLAAFALTGLIVASVFGLDQSTGAVAAGIVLLPVLFVRHASDAVPAAQKTSMGALILFSLSGILLWFVAGASVYTRHDGLYTGVSHNIGDLPFHLATISRFANGQNLPPEHPSFAGVSFTYPFLPDFGGAMFVLAGASAVAMTKWSTLLLALGFVVLLHQWTLAMTDSPRAAILAPGLALFSGGFGWMRFATELWSSDQSPVGFLGHLTHDYTITSDGAYRWGNLVTSLLVTQRGLLLGLPWQ